MRQSAAGNGNGTGLNGNPGAEEPSGPQCSLLVLLYEALDPHTALLDHLERALADNPPTPRATAG
jgi:hypothetical protein